MGHKSVLNGCDSAEVLQKEPQNRRLGRAGNYTQPTTPFARKARMRRLACLTFEPPQIGGLIIKMAAALEGLSPEEICAYVKEQIPSISSEILERFKEHRIDGSVFLELNDEYLREIAPKVGDRLRLKRIITKALNSSSVS